MPIQFSNTHTQADLKQLESLLTPLLQEHYSHKPDTLHALNIACGRADETGLLCSTLAKVCKNLNLTGVDIRERELMEARHRWKSTPLSNISFVQQDASRLSEIRSLPKGVDLVLMRHQNFWNSAETWMRIYDSALQQLSAKGKLIITSYFDLEHLQAVHAISSLGATLLHTFQNPHSRVLSTNPRKSVDRHIAVFSKLKAGNETFA